MKKLLMAAFVLLTLSACAGNNQAVKNDGATANTSGQSGAQVSTVNTPAAEQGTMLDGQKYNVSYEKGAINDANNILSQKILYFDFDSSSVKPEYQELAKYHGRYLALNPDAHVLLEGNTDERGTREYNIALGDRRAQAVKKLLLFQGARDSQISIISYGEEKPADPGHTPAAWAKNRRVVIVYTNK